MGSEKFIMLDDAIQTLLGLGYSKGRYNPLLGHVLFRRHLSDYALIVLDKKTQQFIIKFLDPDTIWDALAFINLRINLKRRKNGMAFKGGSGGDNDSPPEPTPQEIAHQENTDAAFENLEQEVGECNQEGDAPGTDSGWK